MADRKIKTDRLVLVEGKYDRIKLDSMLDALIIPVNSMFVDFTAIQGVP
jgi:5S rRNA maturation endonuclease (ribonuclease M5)